MQATRICYSICERKKYRYITEIDGDVIKLGSEKNRLLFYDENEAENYRQLADDTMDGCFQIVAEKLSVDARIARIIENDVHNPLETVNKKSEIVLKELMEKMEIDIDGLSHKIFQIYNESTDKDSVKEMFESIFGVSFDEYLVFCEKTFETS